MRAELLDIIACPVDGRPLSANGGLACGNGHRYPVVRDVPRLLPELAETDQTETATSFGAKWEQVRDDDKPQLAEFQFRWYDERYGWGDEARLGAHLAACETILDAGSGLGYDAARYARLSEGQVVGMDLTDSVSIAQRDHGGAPNLAFVQGDIMAPPFAPESFDFVVSDQVIHHTPDCTRAFAELARLVRPGGQLSVYVYKKKSLIRELADDRIRVQTTRMSVDECMEFSAQITELGKALSDLDATITLERGVPLLGIPAGTHNVQRLIYWHFLKCFWNDDLGEHQSVMGNFDWYHPPYASRHTEEEVLGWCGDSGLDVVHLDVIESGISVRARRPA
jgi:ubiquinone/menaquinone biosynthesis C-methylase UbiE/uncharacterized protein YbaR (Trm112 family)